MLRSAALTAVQAARYRPYLLSGDPTEVQTTITVVFKLGS
jgi:protein TonB